MMPYFTSNEQLEWYQTNTHTHTHKLTAVTLAHVPRINNAQMASTRISAWNEHSKFQGTFMKIMYRLSECPYISVTTQTRDFKSAGAPVQSGQYSGLNSKIMVSTTWPWMATINQCRRSPNDCDDCVFKHALKV